jgi:hypothetical protein
LPAAAGKMILPARSLQKDHANDRSGGAGLAPGFNPKL